MSHNRPTGDIAIGLFLCKNLGKKGCDAVWIEYNPNPAQSRAGDCAIRAVAKALDTDWEDAYVMLCLNGFLMGDVISSNSVWGSVLRQHDFVREIIPNSYPDDYSLEDFTKDHPRGTFVVALPNHVVTVVDGDYYDAWQSGREKPLYYWSKEE